MPSIISDRKNLDIFTVFMQSQVLTGQSYNAKNIANPTQIYCADLAIFPVPTNLIKFNQNLIRFY